MILASVRLTEVVSISNDWLHTCSSLHQGENPALGKLIGYHSPGPHFLSPKPVPQTEPPDQ